MQQEIDALTGAEDPPLDLRILGVNEAGEESGNASMCANRTCAWLQDVVTVNVWNSLWKPVYRDVWILNTRNEKVFVYNLTTHDLNQVAKYDELKSAMLAAARAE